MIDNRVLGPDCGIESTSLEKECLWGTCKRKKKHGIDTIREKSYAATKNCQGVYKMTIDPWFEWSGCGWWFVEWLIQQDTQTVWILHPLYPKIGGPHSNSSQIECKKTRTPIYKVRELQLWCMDRQVRRYIIYWVASVILSQFTLVGKYDGVERNFPTIKSKGKMTSRTSWWIETWFCHCPIQC